MSYFDIGLLVILAIFIFYGFKHGLIKLFGQVVGLILASYAASHFYLTFYAWGKDMVHLSEGAGKFLAFIILFVVISSVANLIFALIEKVFNLLSVIPLTNLINHILGAALGLLEGGLSLGLILFVASRYAWAGSSLANVLVASKVAPGLLQVVNIIMPFLPEALKALKSIIG
jgi:uncharacterized membrane protein required for colicin V production